jgi:hypothetical protein
VPVTTNTFNRRHFRFESNVSLPSANLDSVDVIVQTIPDNGEHVARTKIRTNADLRSFIQYTKQRNHRNPEYLFLIEDISQGVIDVLQTELGFNALAAENHKQGQVNNCQSRPTKNALHSEKLSSTFYSTNIRLPTASCLSLSWWRLLSQNMEGNRLEGEAFVESKADTSRVITPLFLVQIEEKKTDHKDSSKSGKWYTRYPKNAIKTAVGGFNPLKKADMYEQSVFKLDCHTYRPHQVVTEVKDFMWASACEERISLCDIRTDTAYYCK